MALHLLALLLVMTIAPHPAPAPNVERLEIAGETFRLRLAVDDDARARGLGGVERLAADAGMLFVFPRRRPRTFWMADCLVDIDLLALDDDGRIVAGHAMRAEPPPQPGESRRAYERRLRRYEVRRPVRFLIELPGGSIERLGLRTGAAVDLDAPRLRSLAR